MFVALHILMLYVHVKLLLLEDWRCDQYRWINQGVKMLLQNNPGFVWKITTFPDLVCVCGLKELLNEADRVILSYDTTFQLGDFYVSLLIFRHIIFKERPCIPAMFLLHERNKQSLKNIRRCFMNVPKICHH